MQAQPYNAHSRKTQTKFDSDTNLGSRLLDGLGRSLGMPHGWELLCKGSKLLFARLGR